NVIEISSDKIKGSEDWNSLEYQDTAGSKGKKVMSALSFYKMETDEISERKEKSWLRKSSLLLDQLLDFNFDDVPKSGEELPLFVCKMGKSNRNKKRAMENLNLFYQDIGPPLSAGGHLTQEEATKEALAIRISQKYALLEKERPVIETMAYNDKYKTIIDEIWKDKVELDGKNVKEDEEAVKRLKGEALKEKDDPGAFIFPIRLEGKVNENALAVGVTTIIAKFLILDIPIDYDAPIMVGRGFLYMMGSILNTPERLFSTFDEVCHQTFKAARFDVLRTAESDSDDEQEYVIKRNKFGAPIYGPKPAPYLNLPLKQVNWKPDYKGSYTKEEEATGKWRTEIRLQEHTMTRSDHHDPNAQDIKPWKRQSYHWDMYHGVFEHMAGVYSVPLQGAYNPSGYAQPQYDQYYQQYQPPPPQYQQQQDDDE
ncbi:hypothetical protein Tco_0993792, partial [Tanacetum coccineum]